jgi:hypothetical protein
MGSTPQGPGPSMRELQGSALARAAGRRSAVRVINVVTWAVLAVVFGAGGVGEVTISNVGGAVVSFGLAVFAAWYAVRVWTFRARWLFGPRERRS